MGSSIEEERDQLRSKNMRMMSDFNSYSKRIKRLAVKRDYVDYKYNEYGDTHQIKRYFDAWVDEYINAGEEAKTLKEEYLKKSKDLDTIPTVIADIKSDIEELKKAVFVADYEIDQITGAFPDLYEQAIASEETEKKYRLVHKEFADVDRNLTDFRLKFDAVNTEKRKLADDLSEQKTELSPLLKMETSLKDDLAELTERFDRQEKLREEKAALEEVIKNLEESVGEKRERIKNHETYTNEINAKIEGLKSESNRLRSKIKEYEALVKPYRELKERLERVEAEISRSDAQHRRFTDEIGKVSIENEILQAKANQYEEIKRMMEDI